MLSDAVLAFRTAALALTQDERQAADDQKPNKKLRRSNAHLDLGALLEPDLAADEDSVPESMPGLATAPPSLSSSLAAPPHPEIFLRQVQAKPGAAAYHQLRRRQLDQNIGRAADLETVYGSPIHGPVSWQGAVGPFVCVWPWRSGFAYVLVGQGKAEGYFNLCLTKREASELADRIVSAHDQLQTRAQDLPRLGRPSKTELRESAFALYVTYWPRLPENGLEVPGPLGQA